jgi:hypothetical protein
MRLPETFVHFPKSLAFLLDIPGPQIPEGCDYGTTRAISLQRFCMRQTCSE